jgi:hypothetical protein
MSWIQVISNKGGADDIANMYGIFQIPRMILINSYGEIVSDNLRGNELIKKVKNFLD